MNAEKGTPGSRGKLIVIADDDAETRDVVGESLNEDGFDVLAVADGAALMDAMAGTFLLPSGRRRVDLVITDMVMPRASGLEAMSAIRAAGWHVPIVAVSAFCTEEVRYDAEELGAAAVLDKPVDLAALRDLAVELTANNADTEAPAGESAPRQGSFGDDALPQGERDQKARGRVDRDKEWNVLIAVDLSLLDAGDHAAGAEHDLVALAIEWSQRLNASVELVGVEDHFSLTGDEPWFLEKPEAEKEAAQERTDACLESLGDRLQRAGVYCQTTVLEGRAASRIADHARKTSPRLVIVASPSAGRFQTFASRVASHVLRSARVPVLIIPIERPPDGDALWEA